MKVSPATTALLSQVDLLTQTVPWTTRPACHLLYRLAVETRSCQILEISTGYGKTTTYLAAAASVNGGLVQSVDIKTRSWKGRAPDDLIREAGLRKHCNLTREMDARWFIVDLFTKRPGCWIDMAFLDASHTIEADAFLALGLWTHLRPGGVLVMDDLQWTQHKHGEVTRRSSRPKVRHVRCLFEYLKRMPNAAKSAEWGHEQIRWPYGIIQKEGGPSSRLDLKALARTLQ